MASQDNKVEAGFTLLEVLFVVVIIGIVATLAVQRLGGVRESAEVSAALSDMNVLKDAFFGTRTAPGYLEDVGVFPRFTPVNPFADRRRFECLNLRVHNLFCPTNLQSRTELTLWAENNLILSKEAEKYDPDARRGWRGPYVRGGRWVATTGAKGGERPAPPPDSAEPGYVRPSHFPRLGRFPGPDERRFEGDATFFERGFYHVNDIAPGSSYYGFAGEFALADPWGNPYVIQLPEKNAFPSRERPTEELDRAFAKRRWHYARIVSAGPDGVLQTPRDLCAGRGEESLSARGDDLVLFLNRADFYEDLER